VFDGYDLYFDWKNVALKENGLDQQVSLAEREEYLNLVFSHVLTKDRETQISALKEGLHAIVSVQDLQILTPFDFTVSDKCRCSDF
jgi:hypothetical protein